MAAVGTSPDYERIVALPVRHLSEEQAQKDIELMTPLLTTPLGRAEGARLILWQGTALRELAERDGAYVQLGVGHGKSLIFWLAPYVLDAERPLYICPAALRDDMRAAFRQYARHWKTPKPPPTIMAYSDFFRKGSVDLFERLRPDFVGLDEAHKSTNQDGTFAQRYARWVELSGCKTVCGTGTGTRFSLKDFSHNITWSLQGGAPLPLDFDTLDTWCDALDEKPKTRGAPMFQERKKRPHVGVLAELSSRCGISAPDYALTEQGRARWALQVRLRSTPGVIISNDDSCKQPLTVELEYAPEDGSINAAFDDFREGDGPDGEQYTDAIVLYTKERQLGCGFVHTWDPAPPDEWRAALRERNKYCAQIITRTRATYARFKRTHPCDSPDAVEAHREYGQHPSVLEWQRIKPSYEPKTRPTWVSASVVHFAAQWARANNGLVWYEFEEVGRAIAAAAGCPMFGPGGVDLRGVHIRNDPGNRSVALSIDANLEGRNLQDRWHSNLIIGAPQSARELEQLLGRTHRHGQNHPVRATILVTSGLSVMAWREALREATFVRETQAQEQKILRAAIIEGKPPSKAVRWRTVQKAQGSRQQHQQRTL
jgi:hypothetical protein